VPDKREAIVQAAIDLIGESGPGSFSQPRVAKRVGLRQSHVTYYFPTRDELLAAVAEEAVRQRVAAVRQARDAGGPRDQVAALARVLTSPALTRVLLALTQSADQDEAVRASFGALATGLAPLAASMLEDMGAEVSESSLALLHATSTGIAVLALARDDDVTALAEHLLTELVDRLAVPRAAVGEASRAAST